MIIYLMQLALALLAVAFLLIGPRGEKPAKLISEAIIVDALRWRVMRVALWRRITRPGLGARWRAFWTVIARSWRRVAVGLLATICGIAIAAILLTHYFMTPDIVADPRAQDYPLAVALAAYILSIPCAVAAWFGWKVWRIIRSARALPSVMLEWRRRPRALIRTSSRVIAGVVLLILAFRQDGVANFVRNGLAELGPMMRQAVIASAYAEVSKDRPSPCPGYPLTEDDLVRIHGSTADVILMRWMPNAPYSHRLEQLGIVRNVACFPSTAPVPTQSDP